VSPWGFHFTVMPKLVVSVLIWELFENTFWRTNNQWWIITTKLICGEIYQSQLHVSMKRIISSFVIHHTVMSKKKRSGVPTTHSDLSCNAKILDTHVMTKSCFKSFETCLCYYHHKSCFKSFETCLCYYHHQTQT
jgi:hypothetical protein